MPSQPAQSEGPPPAAALRADLDWVLFRLRRYIGRYGHRLTNAKGTVDDLFVSVDEARRLLRGEVGPDFAVELGFADTPMARLAASGPRPAGTEPGPLATIGERFGLDPLDRQLLFAAAAPGLSMDIARLYRFAWADFGRRRPTVGFLAELCADAVDEVLPLADRFAAGRALRAGGLVAVEDGETRLAGQVSVPDDVLDALRGLVPSGDAALKRAGEPAPTTLDARAERLIRAALDAGARPVMVGPTGAGRAATVRRWTHEQGAPLWILDGSTSTASLQRALRVARLTGGALLIRDALPADMEPVEQHPGPLAFALPGRAAEARPALARAVVVPCALPSSAAQHAAWSTALGDTADADALAEHMVARYRATPGMIRDAVQRARLRVALEPDGALDAEALADALQQRMDHALGALAEPVTTALDWPDVVLPADVLETLREIRTQARHRAQVFEQWGFGRRMTTGRGLACLFSGPPGTGKTMMAGIIARDLGRTLYRVDISRVVSKWVGETEKNLARIFDEAEQAQGVLLFDEADSLFARRTEVRGANDRFANMEVNYLLQRMDVFDGVSILTTNAAGSLDEAFKRRLRFRVHFPMPEADERAQLWQRAIPAATPAADDIDFAGLGKRFRLSGGNIRNAVLRAAFYAADGAGRLDTALLARAAEAEAREMGRL